MQYRQRAEARAKSLTLGALITFSALAASLSLNVAQAAAVKDYGKQGEPIELVVGYQPYYTESCPAEPDRTLGTRSPNACRAPFCVKSGNCSLPGSSKAERAMQTVFHAKVSAIPPSSPQALGSQVVVSNVSKSYGAGTFAKQVVHNSSFTIERGKLTVMIGPSGCGKSTLIRLIAGFERPSSGTVTVDDKPVTGPGVDRLVVFQETALFPWMTTYDNIMKQHLPELSEGCKEALFQAWLRQ